MESTFVLPAFSPTASWMPFAPMTGGIHAIEQLIATLRAQLEAQEAQAHKAMEEANEAYKQVGHDKEEALKAEQQAKAEIASLKAELESTQAQLDASKQEIDKQTASIQTLNTEHQTEQAAAQQAQDRLKAALETSKKELEQLRISVKTFEGRVLPTTPGSRVWISMVIWGGKFLYGEDLYKKCREYCMSRKPVPFTNEFFGCDPMFGVRKTGVIAYQYDGKGLVRYLGLREGESGPFDNWP